MRRVVALVGVLAISLVALVRPAVVRASSIGPGGFMQSLGARLDRPEAAPAVKAGVVYEGTVLSGVKLAGFGIAGAKAGDRVRVTVLAGNKLSVTLLSPAAGAAQQGAAVRATAPARSVTVSYDAQGKLSASR